MILLHHIPIRFPIQRGNHPGLYRTNLLHTSWVLHVEVYNIHTEEFERLQVRKLSDERNGINDSTLIQVIKIVGHNHTNSNHAPDLTM